MCKAPPDVIFPKGLEKPTEWTEKFHEHFTAQREAEKTLKELEAARRRNDKAIAEAKYRAEIESLAAEWCKIQRQMVNEKMDPTEEKRCKDMLDEIIKKAEVLHKEKNKPDEEKQKDEEVKLEK